LMPEPDRTVAYGFPHSIGVRVGTLRLFERLRNIIGANAERLSGQRLGYDHIFADPNEVIGRQGPSDLELSVFVSPQELARLLNVGMIASARLAGVIELTLDSVQHNRPWMRVTDCSVTDILSRYAHRFLDNGATFW